MEVNVHEAKTHLSRLLARVASGEEVTIAKAGVPIARLVPVAPSQNNCPLGVDKENIWMAADFDAPSPEIEALFAGRTPRRSRKGRSR